MRVLWSRRAQDDILDVAEYYDGIDPDLADRIVSRLEAAVLPLGDFTELGTSVDELGPLRKWSVAATPYVLLYVIHDGVVEVQRVVHAASDWRP